MTLGLVRVRVRVRVMVKVRVKVRFRVQKYLVLIRDVTQSRLYGRHTEGWFTLPFACSLSRTKSLVNLPYYKNLESLLKLDKLFETDNVMSRLLRK